MLLSALNRLPNYADRASTLEIDSQGELSYAQDASHRGKNYREDVLGTAKAGAFMGVTSLIYTSGSYYIDITAVPANSGLSVGWFDLGKKAAGPYGIILENYAQIGAAWRDRLAGSTAQRTGSCSAIGRTGIAWRVKFRMPQSAGVKPYAYGTACTDQGTGAPLQIDLSYKALDASGKPVTFEDRFQLTALGSVPRVIAPQGAAPAPKISYAP